VARRGFGELEQAIMEVVWSAEGPVTGREVVDQLTRSRPVVYTTVLTVMDRLARKGILEKHPTGKAHTYRAVQSREAYTAQRMARLLGRGGDPTAVLLRFVEQLPPRAHRQAARRPATRPRPHPTAIGARMTPLVAVLAAGAAAGQPGRDRAAARRAPRPRHAPAARRRHAELPAHLIGRGLDQTLTTTRSKA